jgi:hypothetical protein
MLITSNPNRLSMATGQVEVIKARVALDEVHMVHDLA